MNALVRPTHRNLAAIGRGRLPARFAASAADEYRILNRRAPQRSNAGASHIAPRSTPMRWPRRALLGGRTTSPPSLGQCSRKAVQDARRSRRRDCARIRIHADSRQLPSPGISMVGCLAMVVAGNGVRRLSRPRWMPATRRARTHALPWPLFVEAIYLKLSFDHHTSIPSPIMAGRMRLPRAVLLQHRRSRPHRRPPRAANDTRRRGSTACTLTRDGVLSRRAWSDCQHRDRIVASQHCRNCRSRRAWGEPAVVISRPAALSLVRIRVI